MSLPLRPCGPTALLAEVADSATALDLATWVRGSDDRALRAVEVVAGARTVLLDGVDDLAAAGAALAAWTPGERADRKDLVEVPVTYDGPDLAVVADLWGVSAEEVVRLHTGLELTVAFCGFAPGFAYLAGLPEERAVPRRDSPRTRVPAGSVGLAGPWCGIYPTASPGGWQLIGRTEVVLWDPDRPEPALLPPGTRVRFRAVP